LFGKPIAHTRRVTNDCPKRILMFSSTAVGLVSGSQTCTLRQEVITAKVV
jgi:hypothetical protein